MTVGDLLARISSREIAEWIAEDRIRAREHREQETRREREQERARRRRR